MGLRQKRIGIFGDTDGSLKKALEELEARDSRPHVSATGVDPASLGMGSGSPLPPEPLERDFLNGIPPWAGRQSIQ